MSNYDYVYNYRVNKRVNKKLNSKPYRAVETGCMLFAGFSCELLALGFFNAIGGMKTVPGKIASTTATFLIGLGAARATEDVVYSTARSIFLFQEELKKNEDDQDHKDWGKFNA